MGSGTVTTVCIVNPASAGGKTARAWPGVRDEISRAVGPIDVRMTDAAGHAIRLARSEAEAGRTLIVAVGGDGTVNEVVNGVMEATSRAEGLTLGVIPAGTGSDFAKTLGIPNQPLLAARVLDGGQALPLDVGCVEFLTPGHDPPRRYYVNVASFGIEGVVDRKIRSIQKTVRGKWGYLGASALALFSYRSAPVEIRAGAWSRTLSVFNASVANGRFFGGGMEIAPGASVRDGKLDLVILESQSIWSLLKGAPRLYNGTVYDSNGVEHRSVESVEAFPAGEQEILLGIDGEPIGQLPARFSVRPAALRILCWPEEGAPSPG